MLQEHRIRAIAESLQQQWLTLPRNKRSANIPVHKEDETLVRQLAAQLSNANLIPVSNNAFEQQLVKESKRVLIYEDRNLLV